MEPSVVLRAKVAAHLSTTASISSKEISTALQFPPFYVDCVVHQLWRANQLVARDGQLRLPDPEARFCPPRRQAPPQKAAALAAIKRRDSRDRARLRALSDSGHARRPERRRGVFPKPALRHGDEH
tara:strand:- start:51 stop:428 length:378 start_codon:yes stop_codon:yes gene_type:complete